jgi:hypothetical protein
LRSVKGPIATKLAGPCDVRYSPDSDRTADITGGPVRAKTGLMHCDKRRLFDCRVGTAEQWPRGRLATVDQLLRKALAVLDASGTADGFNNLGARNIMDKIS